jgi:hypothetical protein
MHALARGGALGEAQARTPLGHRANGARDEVDAAIRADIVENRLDAIGAEGAFIAADTSVGRMRGKVLVAIFAVRLSSSIAFLVVDA